MMRLGNDAPVVDDEVPNIADAVLAPAEPSTL